MRPVLVAVCVLLIVSVAFAQSDRGTVTGTISDQTNAVIPGASVVAANTENGTRFETISTETGNYTLTQLPAGIYQLSVELPGFKKYVRQGITVQRSEEHTSELQSHHDLVCRLLLEK